MFYNAEFILYFFSVARDYIMPTPITDAVFFRMCLRGRNIVLEETRSSRFEDAYSRGYDLLLLKNLAWPLDCIMLCAATRTGHTFTYLFYHFNPTKTGIYIDPLTWAAEYCAIPNTYIYYTCVRSTVWFVSIFIAYIRGGDC